MKRLIIFALSFLILAGCSAAPQHSLEFVEGKIVTTEDGTELIGVFCSYTNHSANTCIACDGINVKAFQNGVELTVMVYPETIEGALPCDTAVQAGASAYVLWTFEASDESAVSLEFSDGQRYEFSITDDR